MRYGHRADRLIGIVAGGVVLLAIIGAVVWGLARDDPEAEAAAEPARGPVTEACDLDVRRATLALRAGAADRIEASGASIVALPPAVEIGRGAASLPISNAAAVNCPLTTGRVSTEGGFRLDVAGQATEITGLVIDFDSQTMAVETRSPGFDSTVSSVIDTAAVDGLDRGSEVVYVMAVNLLSNDAGTLDDALQKATLSDGDLPSDATLTLVAAKTPTE
jgi:hypothetical protein